MLFQDLLLRLSLLTVFKSFLSFLLERKNNDTKFVVTIIIIIAAISRCRRRENQPIGSLFLSTDWVDVFIYSSSAIYLFVVNSAAAAAAVATITPELVN